MGKIEVIENEVARLSSSELAVFREWFLEFDATIWDKSIEEDMVSGKLDKLAESALEEFNAGNSTEL